MSVVTDIILTTNLDDGGNEDEHPNADRLSKWLEDGYKRGFVKVSDMAGGTKAMQCDVFMAAVNHLDVEAFIEEFRNTPWDGPAQLMVKREEEDRFTVYAIEGLW